MVYGRCFLCGKWGNLEKHHIFGGAYRKKSEKFGLIVGLCGIECHREGPYAAHKNAETMRKLREYGQIKYMQEHNATIDEFRAMFGRNYLDEPYVPGGIGMIEQAKSMLDELHSSGRLEYHEYSLLWDALDKAEKKDDEDESA
jgi:hypothetical protein